MNFLENEFFLLAITFGIFFLAKLLQKKTGIMLLNPILLTIALLILFLKMTGVSYETYNEGGHLIEFWLKPAVVALGVPLYLQLETIKKQLLPILLSQLAGCTACKPATGCVRLPDALGQDRSGGRLPPGKSDAHYLIRAVKSFFRQPPRATFRFWVQGSGGDRVQWTKQEAAAGAALRFLQGYSCPQQKSAKRKRGESKLLLCLASFPGAE